MKEVIDRFISNILGLVVGYVVGLIVCPIYMKYFVLENSKLFLIITSLLGLIVSVVTIEYNRFTRNQKSTAVRNEAIALITHEMRTGLTSTGWALQLILQKYGDKMDPGDKHNLEVVFDSIHTTVMHSVNLLDISLLDINKITISLEWVTLERIEKTFTDLLKEYVMGAEKKGITLTYNMRLDKEKQVEVDILRLRIILGNLLENAIQYTLNEKKLIEVEINNTDKDLNIAVKDTGIGIPENDQKKIFEEFYRATNAREKLQTGSGIGLYACAQYVKAHKGIIRFESTENVGTTFYVTIPLKTEANVDEFMEQI